MNFKRFIGGNTSGANQTLKCVCVGVCVCASENLKSTELCR